MYTLKKSRKKSRQLTTKFHHLTKEKEKLIKLPQTEEILKKLDKSEF